MTEDDVYAIYVRENYNIYIMIEFLCLLISNEHKNILPVITEIILRD